MTAAAESTRVARRGRRRRSRHLGAHAAPGRRTGKEPGVPAQRVPVTEHRRSVCGGAADSQSPPTSGVIAALSVGFYEGWWPTRAELAAYVAAEFGVTVTAPREESDRPRNMSGSAGVHPGPW